jgi:hypothetical protein
LYKTYKPPKLTKTINSLIGMSYPNRKTIKGIVSVATTIKGGKIKKSKKSKKSKTQKK